MRARTIFSLAIIILSTYTISNGQIPAGYYDSAAGLNGVALKSTLHNIIDNHNYVSYDDLHTYYEVTDKKSNGKVWDMYSDEPLGTPPYQYSFTSSDQCGNYGQEGDCYNREHSWPKSWYNDAMPMYSDLFLVYPTDGYVNGMRGNLPYGEVGSATWTSQNGSKKGNCNYPGYSQTVFEPIDEYKGDFARSYFYMSVRYYGEDGSWPGSDMANGAELETWALNMMLEWDDNDPVSQKEIDRNNEVYNIQNNRNPFIDHPEWVDAIWDYTDISEFGSEKNYLSVYPNPTLGEININANDVIQIEIFDILGNSLKIYSPTKKIDINKFSEGVYMLSIKTNKGTFIQKVIKE